MMNFVCSSLFFIEVVLKNRDHPVHQNIEGLSPGVETLMGETRHLSGSLLIN